ncbi:hypothetical protein CDAR_396081 [Caerostris darwini]|uniref:Uncharacterized protein n=1 Tax=Caerostris darwini TaxID=1538125 RepID=A0AAV4WR51_9ARAC|nr:hypothetical protein CDAR_396081 [Caerostris darwini]
MDICLPILDVTYGYLSTNFTRKKKRGRREEKKEKETENAEGVGGGRVGRMFGDACFQQEQETVTFLKRILSVLAGGTFPFAFDGPLIREIPDRKGLRLPTPTEPYQ